MFQCFIPSDVSPQLLNRPVSGRYKIHDSKDLHAICRVIVHNRPDNCTFKKASWSHWQVWWQDDVLCDIWPTVLKFRFPNGAGAIGRDTVQAPSVRDFLMSLCTAIVEQRTLQTSREADCARRREEVRQQQLTEDPAFPALPDDGKLPVVGPMLAPPSDAKPAAVQPLRRPCNGKLELVLDGEELRVIIAEGTYCSSFRLNSADTRVLLAHAAECLAQLDEPNPTTDEGQPDG
jgi:hypothetical protein